MNINEAYDYVMQKLDELEKEGFKIEKIPSNSRNHQSTIDKYNLPGRLEPSKWYHITIYGDDVQKIWDVQADINKKGIGFDTGGGCWEGAGRDWEIDWSFHTELSARPKTTQSSDVMLPQ